MSTTAVASPQTPIDQPWVPAVNPWIIAISVMLATFMEVLDTSVANVALPHIAGNLSASVSQATWVLTSYLVANAIVLPATGWLSSFFGRKRLLLFCILLFTGASFLCGAATSLEMLVFARILQGVGGGVLQPIAQAVMLESFPPAKRGVAMAVYGMGVIVAPIIGPTLGGWITDNYSWRWTFYINLPVGIVAILMVRRFLEDPPFIKNAPRVKIDYIGFGLLVVWLGALQILLDKGQEEDWFASSLIVFLTVTAIIGLVAFVIHELRVENPIVNLRVLANRNFATSTALITVVGMVLYGTTSLLPLFLQNLMGYPAMQSGMAVSPRGIGALFSMLLVARLFNLVDIRVMIAGGFALLGLAGLWLSNINLGISHTSLLAPIILSGCALGFLFVPLSTTATGTLKTEEIGGATGIYNLMRNLGGGIGISLVSTFLARGAQTHQAQLVANLTPYDPIYSRTLGMLHQTFASVSDNVTGMQQAYGAMYGILVKQASLLAFVDTLRWIGVLCLVCIPIPFLLKKVKGGKGDLAAH
ncbi:MAG TPA: DHA2 family efflux MFS transporter permease subunit [Acidobacteriota bacterium]|nr:DHA2 family efflux MFS transporter permease subunit [Acidobacteriota bacterium]HNG93486.1 DHA2 family efflux MFS transporter permease subunit [Acidobacteriota bacterium]HNH81750.1 DHA2 family efflux MFS transporter permease subunit [Acidobacteriota bacterium]